jgi:hypothetical protein
LGDGIFCVDLSDLCVRFCLDLGNFLFFVRVRVFVFLFIICSAWMSEAPSPFALMLARAFSSAAAELGKECVVSYENPSVPLRVVPASEYAAVPSVPLASASVPSVIVPDGCRPYNMPVCFCVCVFCLLFICLFLGGL